MTTDFGGDSHAAPDSGELQARAPAETETRIAQAGEPVPVDADPQGGGNAGSGAEPVRVVVTADADNVVRLPDGTSIEKIAVEGQDLLLIQPDGSVIVVEKGALDIPTFVIGDVEIPEVALVAALEANGIDVAAGPDGLSVVSNSLSSGGNFSVSPAGIGDAGSVIGLLSATELQFGGPEGAELSTIDTEPDIGDIAPGFVDEEGLSGGNDGDSYSEGDLLGNNTTASGNLNIDFDYNGPHATEAIVLAATGATWTQETATTGHLIADDGSWRIDVAADGTYTFRLLKPLAHDGVNVEDDIVLTVTVTARDADGDTATKDFTITIDDDAPVVSANAPVQIDDDVLAGNSGGLGDDADAVNASGTLSHSFGADGGTIEWLPTGAPAGFTYEVDGSGSLLVKQGGTLVLTVTLDAATGAYTVTQNAPIAHAPGSDENNQAFTFAYRVTDGDGDTAEGTLSVDVDDDTPTAEDTVPGAFDGDIFLPDDPLDDEGATSNTGFSGNDGGNGDVFGHSNTTSGYLDVSFGADGLGDLDFAGLDNTAAPFKAIYNDGGSGAQEGVTYRWDAATHTLTAVGDISENTVFTLTIDDLAVGHFTFQLNSSLVHADTDETQNLSIVLPFTVTDGDGDTAAANLTIQVNDDMPTVSIQRDASVTVDEDDIRTLRSIGTNPNDGNGDGSFTGNPADPFDFGPAIASGSVGSLVDFGADGAAVGGGFGFVDDAAARMEALGLQSKGTALSFTVEGDTLIGYVDNGNGAYDPSSDRTVLSFTLKSDGDYTLRLHDQLDHVAPAPGTADENPQLATVGGGSLDAIDFGSIIKVTDGDGDSLTLGGKVDVTVTDDVPEVRLQRTGGSVIHDETAGAQGGGADDLSGVPAFLERILFSGVADKGDDPDVAGPGAIGYARDTLFTYSAETGADGPRSQSLSLSIVDSDSGLATTEGDPIELSLENGMVIGRVVGGAHHGEAAFAIAIDPLGGVNVAQYLSLGHENPDRRNEPVDLSGKIDVVFSVTDADGDTVTRTIGIGDGIAFRDDGPRVTSSAVTLTAEENDIFNLRSQGSDPLNHDEDSTSQLALLGGGFASTITGSVAATVSFGADGQAAGGGFSFAADATTRLDALGLTSQGGDVIFTQVDNALIGYVDGKVFGFPTPGFQPVIDRPVMSLTLNPDGTFTFRLYDQLDHVAPALGTADENAQLATAGGGSLDAIDFGSIIEATDGDGDSIPLTGKLEIAIKDDVPVVSIHTQVAVTIDESGGQEDNNTGARGVKRLFNDVEHVGSDADMAGPIYARNDIVDTTLPVGADEPHPVTLSLRLNGADGLDSGLRTTGGKEIHLFEENGLIVGRYDSDNSGTVEETDDAAFAIAIDQSGRVSIAQYVSLEHLDGTDADDRIDLGGTASVPGDKILAVATVTDYDGDTVSTMASIGSRIRFEDDGPQAVDDAPRTVAEDAAQIGDNVLENDRPGADGATLTHVKLPGSGDFVAIENGSHVGGGVYEFTTDVGTYRFKADGSWTFDPAPNQDQSAGSTDASFEYRITDGDGDTATAKQTIDVTDGAVPTGGAPLALVVDEEALPAGNNPGSSAETDNGPLAFTAGSDDLVQFAFGATSGITVTDENGDSVSVVWSIDGAGQLVGTIGGQIAITLALTPPASIASGSTGNVTVTAELTEAFPHAMGGTGDIAIAGIEVIASDHDGDSAAGTVDIRVVDEVPLIGNIVGPAWFSQNFDGASSSATASDVAFSDAGNGWWGQVSIHASGDNGIVTKSGTGNYALLTQSGPAGDETGPFTRFDDYKTEFQGGFKASVDIYLDTGWDLGTGFDYSVAAGDQDEGHRRDFIFHVTKDRTTGQLLVGASNNTNFDPIENLEAGHHAIVGTSGWYTFEQVFRDFSDGTLAVDLNIYDASGALVFTQTLHAPSDSLASIVGGNRYGWFTNIDVPGGIAVDNVALTPLGDIGYVNEDDLAGGNDPDDAQESTEITGSLNVNWGADDANPVLNGSGPGDRSLVFTTASAPADLTSHNEAVSYWVSADGRTLVAYRGSGASGEPPADQVFKVTLSDEYEGSYTFTLLDTLDHPSGLGQNDLTLTFNFEAIDSDGDRDSSSFRVAIHDDVPQAVADDPVSFDEGTGVHGGNVLANDILGADGATLTKIRFNSETTFHDIATEGTPLGGGVYAFALSGVGTYTFTADGTWTFTPEADFSGAAGFSYIITDGDGDESDPHVGNTVEITVNPVNDAPVAVDDAVMTDEDTPVTSSLSLLDNDSDVDGDVLSITRINGNTFTVGQPIALASGALLTIHADGTFTYDPNGAFEALGDGEHGTDSFTYTVSDGSLSDTATVTITVDGANEPPTVNESTSPVGRYAFTADLGWETPKHIDLEASSLFAGGGAYSYTIENVYVTNSDAWVNWDGARFTGDPEVLHVDLSQPPYAWTDTGLHIYHVTASDGANSVSTYVAFSAIEALGGTFDIQDDFSLAIANWLNPLGDLILINDDIDDTLEAGGGHDVVVGSAWGETVEGGSGDDALYGGGGDDTLRGGSDNDFLDGGDGDDMLRGQGGWDVLLGGAGNDTLFGNGGNDILVGGTGSDTMVGGGGADTFVIDPDSLDVSIEDVIADYSSAEGDVVDLTALFTVDPDGGDDVNALSDFVRINPDVGTELQVDADGGGDSWVTVAHFDAAQTAVNILYQEDGTNNSGTV